MALNIKINKVNVAASFAAGATVATAVASGGTTPYVYSLATGSDKFAINGSTGVVTTIAAMNIDNIASFSVTATDSTSQGVTSAVIYPSLQAKNQSKFNRSNTIYKITRDIDLGNGVLGIPSGCTLDFQGGKFTNGLVVSNKTIIKGNPQDSPLFGAFWTTDGKLYGSLIDYTSDTPDSVLSYYPAYSNSSYGYGGVVPSYTSGMCMNDQYIFTFTITDKSTTGPDYKSIFCVNDHKGNLVSSGVINLGGHANDAAILGDSIILPCTENGTITKFLISDLVNGNGTIVNGTTFMTDTCYSLDVDGDFIYTIAPDYVRQYDITGTTLIKTFNINVEAGGPFKNNSDYTITNQAIVVKDGILYVNETISGPTQLGYATAMYDLATLTPITIQPVKINTLVGESEGLCKYNGSIYMSLSTEAKNRLLNMLYKLPTPKKDVVSAGHPLNNQSLLMIRDVSTIVYYVNSDYTGVSNGSQSKPFKSLDDAFAMITPTMAGCTITLTNTGKNYEGFSLVNVGVPIIIDGGNNNFISPITIQLCNRVYLRSATLKNSTIEIYKSNVELASVNISRDTLVSGSYGINSISNSTLEISGMVFTNVETCIKGGYTFIKYLNGLTLGNASTVCNISSGLILCNQLFTKAQLLALKTYPFIGGVDVQLVGESMKFSTADINEITTYYNTLSSASVPTTAKIKWNNGYVIDGTWIQKNDGNYLGAFVDSTGFQLGLDLAGGSPPPTLSGIAGRKDGFKFYNGDTKKLLINVNNTYYDAYGNKDVPQSGPTSSRPSGADVRVGFQYFDSTLGKPIFLKDGTPTWVDATGTTV